MSSSPVSGFDGMEGGKFDRVRGSNDPCGKCGHPLHEHDKERVYPDDGPSGSYHYRLSCP